MTMTLTGGPGSEPAMVARSSALSRRPFDQRFPATVRSRVRTAPSRRPEARRPGVTRSTRTPGRGLRDRGPDLAAERGFDRAAGVDHRHARSIVAVRVDIAADGLSVGGMPGRGLDRVERPVAPDERLLDSLRPVRDLADAGDGEPGMADAS